jgi:hypothetical protein
MTSKLTFTSPFFCIIPINWALNQKKNTGETRNASYYSITLQLYVQKHLLPIEYILEDKQPALHDISFSQSRNSMKDT